MRSPDRDAAEARLIDPVPPVEAEDYPWALAAAAQEDVPTPAPDRDPPEPDWLAPYEALQRDWNELIDAFGKPESRYSTPKDTPTSSRAFRRWRRTVDIPAETRAPMIEALENHQRDLSARKHVEDYLDAAERHMDTHASLQRVADGLGVPIVQISDHLGWRQEADRLMATAEAILPDGERYDLHLDNMETGHARVEREAITAAPSHPGGWRIRLSKVKTPEPHREPIDTREEVEQPEPATPAWMPAYEALAAGLEQPHRRRPASRYPIILRQGLHGHHTRAFKRLRRTRISRPNHGHP